MRRNIKLNRKPEPPAPKESRFFFVKDQGTGAVRVLVIIFKLLELFLTTVYGVCLGVFAPLALWLYPEELEMDFTVPAVLWLTASVLYIAGLFTLIFAKEKLASIIHGAAAVLTIVTYASFHSMLSEYGTSGPAGLFMPCLLITALTITILLLLNVPEWTRRYIEKSTAPAPSILGGEYSKGGTRDNRKEKP